MRIVIGFVLAGIGVLLMLKTEWFVQNFGSNAWAEEHLGSSGGTRLLVKLIAIAFIFFGFLAITNLHMGFLDATLGKIFKQNQAL